MLTSPSNAGNIVTIGVLIGAFVLYSVYQRNQGRPVAAQQGKKTN